MREGKLTNAAILLFGKNPQMFFIQSETRCARFKGVKPLEFIDMKVFGGNIIDQREDAVEFVNLWSILNCMQKHLINRND